MSAIINALNTSPLLLLVIILNRLFGAGSADGSFGGWAVGGGGGGGGCGWMSVADMLAVWGLCEKFGWLLFALVFFARLLSVLLCVQLMMMLLLLLLVVLYNPEPGRTRRETLANKNTHTHKQTRARADNERVLFWVV